MTAEDYSAIGEAFSLLFVFMMAVGAFLALYALVALGRIWYYSKRQLRELEQIRELLSRTPSTGGAEPRFTAPR